MLERQEEGEDFDQSDGLGGEGDELANPGGTEINFKETSVANQRDGRRVRVERTHPQRQ